MPKSRLSKIIVPCVLSLSLSPTHAAVFSGGGGGPSTPNPPRSNTLDSSGEMTDAQMSEVSRQLEELSKDPKKLQETVKQLEGLTNKQYTQNSSTSSSTSSGASSSTSSGSGMTRSQEDIEAIRADIEKMRQKNAAGERKALEDEAFTMLLEKALPMNPDQIKLLRKLYDTTQKAVAHSPTAPPTPMSSSSVVSLEPGKTPPVVRLSAGFVTSVVFSDSTGAPWPLISYTLGDPSVFNVQWDQKSNTLFIQALKTYTHGNLAVTLYDNTTPVMLSLVSGQKEVDFRIDFQIAGRGPEATAPIMSDSLSGAKVNPILINILDGIPPRGSVKLNVSGNYGDAWVKGDTLYFRSKLVVLSPAWVATVSSPDGTHVYEMMHTPSILASKDGQTIDIRLTGL